MWKSALGTCADHVEERWKTRWTEVDNAYTGGDTLAPPAGSADCGDNVTEFLASQDLRPNTLAWM